jgi:isopentenyl diphosphate isomerase/L-lactate dehydrogenase-like FMN-dependent dehydrogenase
VSDPVNLHDFCARARDTLGESACAYLDGGASDEITLRENEAAFQRRRLRPRVLRDVTDIDTTTRLLGAAVAMPIGVAPTAYNALFHPDAEPAVARAAAHRDVMYVASTNSSCSMETIAKAEGPRWFQLYAQEDDAVTGALIRRAEAAGYGALVVTVDTAAPARRERDTRLSDSDTRAAQGNAAPGQWLEAAAPFLTWELIGRVRDSTSLPLVLKGIMTGEDAALAVEHGAAAVWVSNHGGRQLDRAPATLEVLEEVVAAVGGGAEVYVDGGVRRGADAIIAVALGARAVFVGRPVLYALACGGEQGVRDALRILDEELRNAMALLGVRSVGDISRECVV